MCLRSLADKSTELVITVPHNHTYVIELNKDQLELLLYQATQIREKWLTSTTKEG
jgi:hypothetical protein